MNAAMSPFPEPGQPGRASVGPEVSDQPVQPAKWFFRVRYRTALRRTFGPGTAPLEIHLDGANEVLVTLRRPTEEEDSDSELVICEARGLWEVAPELITLFEDLEAQRLPAALRGRTFATVAPAIRLEGIDVPFESLPHSYDAFESSIATMLHQAAAATLRQVRWRYGLAGGYRPITSTFGLERSTDGRTWLRVVSAIIGELWSTGYPKLDEQAAAEVQSMAAVNDSEPLGHELLREAEELRQSPRSALVIAVAALEVGLKEFIARRVPEAAWLVEHLQSPPVSRMLRDYVPGLINDPSKAPPKTLRTMVDTAIEKRNAAVHRGAPPPTLTELRMVIEGVRDLLYLFDFYSGHPWALEQLSVDTLRDLGIVDDQGRRVGP
jgi:hypothetical protein